MGSCWTHALPGSSFPVIHADKLMCMETCLTGGSQKTGRVTFRNVRDESELIKETKREGPDNQEGNQEFCPQSEKKFSRRVNDLGRSAKLRTDCWFINMDLIDNLDKGIFYGGIGTGDSEYGRTF